MNNRRSLILHISYIVILIIISATTIRHSRSDKAQEQVLNTDRVSDTEQMEETEDNEQTLHYVDAWGEWHDTIIRDDIAKHDYDWTCLKQTENGIIYEGDSNYAIRKGIDVSYHQGDIDWKKVKDAGYDFAFIRIAYRGYGEDGQLNADRMALANIEEAQATGMDVGVYVFSQAVNEEEAEEEAGFVLDQLQGRTLELPIVYDSELIRDDEARTDSVTGEQFTANTIAFCERIKEAGYQPMIYSNMVWEADLYDLGKLQSYPIWYADYEQIPQTPYAFRFWQYSEKGTVDGISGDVDLDVEFIIKR